MAFPSRARQTSLRKKLLNNRFRSDPANFSALSSAFDDSFADETSLFAEQIPGDAPPTSNAREAPATTLIDRVHAQIRRFNLSSNLLIAEWELWDAAKRAEYEERLRSDPDSRLQQLFKQCTTSTPKKKTVQPLDELNSDYADEPKEKIFGMIIQCARWIRLGARLSTSKGQDMEIAEALEKKWAKMNYAQVTEHMMVILEFRSIEDLRSMLADAFEDIEKRIDEATDGNEAGLPIVRQGASSPDPGKEWYSNWLHDQEMAG